MKKITRNFFPQIEDHGFTLIELLVVIAIIGILSSVVLSNLSISRGKAANAGVRSGFTQIRTQANLYLLANDNYGTAVASGSCTVAPNTMFTTDAKIVAILTSIQSSANNNTPVCRSSAGTNGAWLVSVQLAKPEGSNPYLCTDSTGALGSHLNAVTSGTACP